MQYHTEIKQVKETEEGTYYIGFIPKEHIRDKLERTVRENLITAEIVFNDGRRISSEQRKKIFAILRDIAAYTGHEPEELKEIFKFMFCGEYNIDYFSLSNRKPHAASITVARHFINYLINFVLANSIALNKAGLYYTDDIKTYLYLCIKHRKCSLCGRPADIHHWDAIGMGNDRRTLDDSNHRKIALCRTHHTEAHQIGNKEFAKRYKVYGIIFKEEGVADNEETI